LCVSDASETFAHPVFGRLEWQPKESRWFTQYRLPSGGQLDVHIQPYRTDRHAFVDPAAELFQWALNNERRILRHAVKATLLELYNEGWRQDGDPMLSADEFAAQLEWQLLRLTANSAVPVEFWYDPGELYESFGGHVVSVEVGPGLQFRSAHLVG
jgi:hypothetical protein